MIAHGIPIFLALEPVDMRFGAECQQAGVRIGGSGGQSDRFVHRLSAGQAAVIGAIAVAT